MRLFMSSLGVLVGLAGVGQVNAELLVNGGAEEGPLSTGWLTDSAGDIERVRSQGQSLGTVTPYEGEWFWSFSRQNDDKGSIWQTGRSGLAAPALTLSGYYQTERFPGHVDDDSAVATLSFLDAEGIEMASSSTERFRGGTWTSFIIGLDVPDGASQWKVTLAGRREYGVKNNVFYDGVSLVPEPSTAVLAGLGVILLLGGAAWRRRKRAA